MDSNAFSQLYQKQSGDETLTAFEGDVGFSLIKTYPEQTPYFKDGYRMFIKVALSDQGVVYSVNMTSPRVQDGKKEYILTNGNQYKKKVTNYYSGGDEFNFDFSKQIVVHTKTKREFSINEFVNILTGNHLSDRLFWKRKLNWCVNYFLKSLFWLSDKHYEYIRVSLDKYHFSRGDKPETKEEINIEPFFKYFYISKNLIFTLLLLAFVIAILSLLFPHLLQIRELWQLLFGEFSLSNPMAVLLFFLILFTSEKFSLCLNKSIMNFLLPSKDHINKSRLTFVEKLHNFQQSNHFTLKLSLRTGSRSDNILVADK